MNADQLPPPPLQDSDSIEPKPQYHLDYLNDQIAIQAKARQTGPFAMHQYAQQGFTTAEVERLQAQGRKQAKQLVQSRQQPAANLNPFLESPELQEALRGLFEKWVSEQS